MKAKDREVKKSLSLAELSGELHQSREKLFKLQLKHRVAPLANPLELRSLRRHVARLKTWVGEKQSLSRAEETK